MIATGPIDSKLLSLNHYYLPVPIDLGVEHESNVVGKSLDSVDPHESDGFKDGQPENPESTSVGVHDVKDI